MKRLSLPAARKMLREILLSNPEAVFAPGSERGCMYFLPTTEEPCCLVGHVFVRVGIRCKDLDGWANTTPVDSLERVWKNAITPAAVEFLREAQRLQDNGVSWGSIYEYLFGSKEEES